MKIPFNFISSFLAGDFPPGNYEVSFLAYVKSQLQYNIFAHKKSRNLSLYLNAYEHLEGQGSYYEETTQVLLYFYEDLRDMLVERIVKDDLDFTLSILIEDSPRPLPVLSIDLKDIEGQLGKVLDNETQDFLIAGVLSKFSVDQLSTMKTSKHLALASALHDILEERLVVRLEPEWEEVKDK